MKLYEPTPMPLVRIQLLKGKEAEYLTLCETTKEEVFKMVENAVINEKVSPFMKGGKTGVHVREAVGSKNGKSSSFSIIGLTPVEVRELILKELKKEIYTKK